MFAHLKATLLKVDLREGKKVLVFETEARLSGGELEALSEMIKKEVILGVDSQVISYRVRKNARTDKPVVTYKVDEATGMVEEVKPEGEQLELNLGLEAEKTPIKEETVQIEVEIVQAFIRSGLAPRMLDDEYDLPEIIRRHEEGEGYAHLAAEIDLSTGKLAELLEDYYSQIAPLAAKWDEWRRSKAKAEAVDPQAGQEPGEAGEDAAADPDDAGSDPAAESDDSNDDAPPPAAEDQSAAPDHADDLEDVDDPSEASGVTDEELTAWEQEIMGGQGSANCSG